MPSVSPSLVEAAARAIRERWPLQDVPVYGEADPGPDYTITDAEPLLNAHKDADAIAAVVLAAVGDALRLEGREAAQFEAYGITDADVYAAHERGRLEGAQARDTELRTIIIQAMKFRPCHEFCSHLWCDKGINEQSLADLLQILADRGYHNAELMCLEGAQAEHAHTVNEICDAILARIDASSDYYVNQYSNDVLHAIVEAVRLAGGVTDAP